MNEIPKEIAVVLISSIFTAFTSILVAVLNLRANKTTQSYRKKREESEAAKKDLQLSISRIILLDFYKRAYKKGTYTLEERDVYHPLFLSYKACGGNGIIDEIAEKIVNLPTSLPTEKD